MKPASLAANEAARLLALHEYKILDTAAEVSYDDFTYLASYICGAPISTITLVDAERQWFKSRIGMPMAETSRDIAFCAHAILQHEVFVVPDATKDERFADSPLVTGAPKIRFYAGAPLINPEGHALGTLCVMDQKPRTLAEAEARALRAIGRQVMTELELRRRSANLRRTVAELKLAHEQLARAKAALEANIYHDVE